MPRNPVPLYPLGKNGPKVPHLGYGTMGLTYQCYGTTPSEEEQFKILDRAHELGSTFWDSADLYGGGEELIGKWFKRTGKRNDIFLSTKFGFVTTNGTLEVDSSGEYCKKACAESLRKLDVDFIDLFYVHHVNPATPIEETMRALKELQDEGKIKHIGLSAISSKTLRRAVKIAPVACAQIDYSPFVLDIETSIGTDLLTTCRELGVGIVAAMPLGRGLLTSTFAAGEAMGDGVDSRTKIMPRFVKENRDKNMKLVQQFKALADKKGCTTAQLALAWVLKQGNDIIPIPGTKRIKYLEENWASLDVELTDEEEKEVRKFVEKVDIAGGALPDAYKDYNYRDTAGET